MKKVIVIGMLLALVGCRAGPTGATGATGAAGLDGANGADGSNGLNGADGSNGFASLLKLVSATKDQCKYGGSVIQIGVDKNRNNVLDVAEITQQSIVCSNN